MKGFRGFSPTKNETNSNFRSIYFLKTERIAASKSLQITISLIRFFHFILFASHSTITAEIIINMNHVFE